MAKHYVVIPFGDTKGRKVGDYTQSFTVNPTLWFSNEAQAYNHARHLAAKTPGVDVLVLESVASVIASDPKFTTKKFTAEGELRAQAG